MNLLFIYLNFFFLIKFFEDQRNYMKENTDHQNQFFRSFLISWWLKLINNKSGTGVPNFEFYSNDVKDSYIAI